MHLSLKIGACVVTAASLALDARQLWVHAHVLCQGLHGNVRFELDLQLVLDLEFARFRCLIIFLAHTILLEATS